LAQVVLVQDRPQIVVWVCTLCAMCADRRLKLTEVVADRQNGTLEELEATPLLVEWARTSHQKEKGGLVLVAPGLFLGNKQAAADVDLLDRKGIVAVCAVGARQVFRGAGHHVSIEDDGSDSMLPHFEAACNFIHEHHRPEQPMAGAVLVHCKGGISRSPTVVIAYLMKHYNLSLTSAMEVCCLARPAARPRENFLQDLETYETRLVEERRWQVAADLATEEAAEALAPRDPGPSKEEVRAECSRLLEVLQERCTLQAFGEAREPSWQLRDAARAAVTSVAERRGWRKAVRKHDKE